MHEQRVTRMHEELKQRLTEDGHAKEEYKVRLILIYNNYRDLTCPKSHVGNVKNGTR